MKKLGLLLMLFTFAACTNDDFSVLQENEEITLPTAVTRASGDKLYDLLGYGYDVTGLYFTSASAKSKIIDIVALRKDYEERVDIGAVPSNYARMTSGTTAQDYTRNVTSKVKLGGALSLFSGSLSSSFSSTQHYTSKYSIADYTSFIRRRRLFLTASTELLSKYLTKMFVDDLSKQSPSFIIQHYGTHVLTDITLGGRITVLYRSSINTSKKTATVEAGCASGIKNMFNLSVDGHYDQTLVKDNSEQEIVYRTEGGDPSRALIGQLNYDSKNSSVIDISSWQQSCDDNNMTLVDAEPGSLIPIYDLVSDMGKKEQLKLAVENYLKEHSYVDIDDSSKGGAVRNNSRGHNTSSYGNSTRVIGANGNRSTYRRP